MFIEDVAHFHRRSQSCLQWIPVSLWQKSPGIRWPQRIAPPMLRGPNWGRATWKMAVKTRVIETCREYTYIYIYYTYIYYTYIYIIYICFHWGLRQTHGFSTWRPSSHVNKAGWSTTNSATVSPEVWINDKQGGFPIPSESTLWLCQNSHGKSPFFMGKSTISMAIFNSYVKLPESFPLFSNDFMFVLLSYSMADLVFNGSPESSVCHTNMATKQSMKQGRWPLPDSRSEILTFPHSHGQFTFLSSHLVVLQVCMWLWINTYENTIFRGLFTSINPSYFDVNKRGTRFWHTPLVRRGNGKSPQKEWKGTESHAQH